MSSFAALVCQHRPVKIAVLYPDDGKPVPGLNLAGLVAPLQTALGQPDAPGLELALYPIRMDDTEVPALFLHDTHLALLVAEPQHADPGPERTRRLMQTCQQARYWGALGQAVLWLANSGALTNLRAALPWDLVGELSDTGEQAILVPNLFELDGRCLTCCGGTASIDFSLTLLHALFGANSQAAVMEALCVDKVRDGEERQRTALHTRFGVLQPQLSEAVTLMENNIEETLSTDDIAQLVGLSRRQLERQFKQYLGSMPARYYLELRLKRARQLLLESNSSIVQIGLMCGFSSGAHFSTAFSAQFGVTPREERQKKLAAR